LDGYKHPRIGQIKLSASLINKPVKMGAADHSHNFANGAFD
jgi:hypothetical protein